MWEWTILRVELLVQGYDVRNLWKDDCHPVPALSRKVLDHAAQYCSWKRESMYVVRAGGWSCDAGDLLPQRRPAGRADRSGEREGPVRMQAFVALVFAVRHLAIKAPRAQDGIGGGFCGSAQRQQSVGVLLTPHGRVAAGLWLSRVLQIETGLPPRDTRRLEPSSVGLP